VLDPIEHGRRMPAEVPRTQLAEARPALMSDMIAYPVRSSMSACRCGRGVVVGDVMGPCGRQVADPAHDR